jgi:hypothetical protein
MGSDLGFELVLILVSIRVRVTLLIQSVLLRKLFVVRLIPLGEGDLGVLFEEK